MGKEPLSPLVSTRQTGDVGHPQPKPGKSEPRRSDGTPEIHWAVMAGDSQLAERLKLLDSPAGPRLDVNARDELGRKALHWAVVLRRPVSVTALLRDQRTERSLREMRDNDWRTPLHEAAIRGYDDVVDALLQEYEDTTSMRTFVNAEDTGRRTALHWSAERGHAKVVEKLLFKAELEARDDLGNTALHRAAQRGRTKVVEMLSDVQAKLEPENHGDVQAKLEPENHGDVQAKLEPENHGDVQAKLEPKNYGDETPFNLAVRYDQAPTVLEFLDRPADAAVRPHRLKVTPDVAVKNGCEAVVCLLLEKSELQPRHEDMVRGLIKTCPDLRSKNRLLAWAANTGHADLVQVLMEKGAHPMAQDAMRDTVLSYAVRGGHMEVVKLLLADPRVHPDSKNNVGDSPLGQAFLGGYKEVAKLLLADPRVNPNLECMADRTPLCWAAATGNKEVVEMLLADPRVDPKQAHRSGGTPLELARRLGMQEVEEVLRIDEEKRSQLSG